MMKLVRKERGGAWSTSAFAFARAAEALLLGEEEALLPGEAFLAEAGIDLMRSTVSEKFVQSD
jgi:hypothetical protein